VRVLPIAPGMPGPISFSPIPGYQQTSYRVSWGAASGTVTHYDLQEANNSSFAGAWSLAPNGPTFMDVIEQAGGSWWYRVRACNGTSCSAYRVGGPKVVMDEDPAAVDPEAPTDDSSLSEVTWQAATLLRPSTGVTPTLRELVAAAGSRPIGCACAISTTHTDISSAS
jgi:hypothetical protein